MKILSKNVRNFGHHCRCAIFNHFTSIENCTFDIKILCDHHQTLVLLGSTEKNLRVYTILCFCLLTESLSSIYIAPQWRCEKSFMYTAYTRIIQDALPLRRVHRLSEDLRMQRGMMRRQDSGSGKTTERRMFLARRSRHTSLANVPFVQIRCRLYRKCVIVIVRGGTTAVAIIARS